MRKLIRVILAFSLLFVALAAGMFIYQNRTAPVPDAPYVALGSSYAAGLGLGPHAPGTPKICHGSINGYPQQFARLAHLSLTDMSCSGATMMNVLRGGQFFLGPQIAAIGPDTKLVTLTAGGNDIDYTRDLFFLSFEQRGGLKAFIIRHLWSGPQPASARNFSALQNNLNATLQQIKQRAPHARVLVVTYANAIPLSGTCAALGINAADAALMRNVADQLAAITRAIAAANNASLVDMASLSAGHDACSASPWINGATPAHGIGFHPTLAGATATAQQVMQAWHENS